MTYPQPSDINNSLGLLTYANEVSGNWLIPLFVIAIFIVTLAITRKFDYKLASCASLASFVTIVFAALFWVGELLTGNYVVMYLAILVISTLWMLLTE